MVDILGRIIKNILGAIERLLFFLNWNRKGLYVINYHGTPKSVLNNFEQHLKYYKQYFHILNPGQFEEKCKDGTQNKKSKPELLLTFDDGMKNNVNAIRLLNEANIKAYFFVIPAFIESDRPKHYLSTIIRPGYMNKKETEEEDFLPLSWAILEEASCKGHKIGSHTYSHSLVREDNLEKSIFEIVESKTYIENRLSIEVPYFCSINYTDVSIGKSQDDLIKQHYSFHFTTYYGNNFPKLNPLRIERINVEAYWSMNELRFALGTMRKLLLKK